MRLFSLLILAFIATIAWAQGNDDPEVPTIDSTSPAFVNSTRSSIQRLSDAGFEKKLHTPSLGANVDEIFKTQLQRINSATPIPTIDELQKGTAYDIILQPGHYGRPPGKLGTHGISVTERALVAYIADVAARRLRGDGFSVLLISADRYPQPLPSAKIFLAIHAEGTENPCKAKASLAYDANASPLAMHAVGWALSSAMGYRYSEIASDNYTAGERDYYMFKRVKTNRLTGLVEIGELTCVESEKQLITSSELIGNNIAAALKFIARMEMATK